MNAVSSNTERFARPADAARQRHILILPSEQFLPAESHLAGIFQHHQIQAMQGYPLHFGVLSVRLRYSLPMLVKNLVRRCFGRPRTYPLTEYGFAALGKLLWQRLLPSQHSVTFETIAQAQVVRVEGAWLLPPHPRWDHLSWLRAGKHGFFHYVKRHGMPDLIHAHNALNAGLLAQWIQRRYGVPYLLTEHSSYYQQGRVPMGLLPMIRQTVAQARRYFVVSPQLGRVMVAQLGPIAQRAEPLANVLPPLFEEQPLPLPVKPANPFVFLAVGNLLPVKGHALLLESFALAFAGNPHMLLRLAGDGPLREALTALAARLGLEPQITFLGEISAQQVKQEMLTAHALVLSSHIETFGVVLIEAMACGLPVLATACGGPNDLVETNNGLLVPPGEPSAMAQAMQHLQQQWPQFEGAAIRQNALERYGSRGFAQRLYAIYQDACS
ncbi:glycosyl transferase, group 1 [Magnetococcus marinus MC-1]|uniref:Glycosyl transferase, group 1 n=1 Tax=Magnetococcus marinus (strain ATCC BAA-1437 / JCM 17883 / MC-1) TaxID=156889 RepID=A0LC88_MAGMM|nr:glycosyltransferase family 4 protein [Magnetococcus marinus]ABK45581.1 glycosyl transferase, group 1 [Magnetococcus marinus MC-1]